MKVLSVIPEPPAAGGAATASLRQRRDQAPR